MPPLRTPTSGAGVRHALLGCLPSGATRYTGTTRTERALRYTGAQVVDTVLKI